MMIFIAVAIIAAETALLIAARFVIQELRDLAHDRRQEMETQRVRLTAEGKLRTCLFSLHETDLREPLRSGTTDAELETVIRDAVWRKELKHHVGEPGFRQPPRTMSAIGG